MAEEYDCRNCKYYNKKEDECEKFGPVNESVDANNCSYYC